MRRFGSALAGIALLLVEVRATAEVHSGLQRWREAFLRKCEARTPNLRVLSVANKKDLVIKTGGVFTLCALALSVEKAGCGSLGVLGLSHSRTVNRRSLAYWDALLRRYLDEPLPPELVPDIPKLVSKYLALKNIVVLEHLEAEADETLVLYVDAFDVLLQGTGQEVVRAYCERQWSARLEALLDQHGYHRAKSHLGLSALASTDDDTEGIDSEKIVFSAEENCYPFPNYWSKRTRGDKGERPGAAYGDKVTSERIFDMGGGRKLFGDELCFEQERLARGQRRFLNSGGIIGRAGHLRQFLRLTTSMIAEGEPMDQATLQLVFLRNPHLAVLDVDATIFLNLHVPDRGAADPVPIGCNGLSSGEDSRRPPVLHFNGNGKRIYARCKDLLLGVMDPAAGCPHFDDLDMLWNRSLALTAPWQKKTPPL